MTQERLFTGLPAKATEIRVEVSAADIMRAVLEPMGLDSRNYQVKMNPSLFYGSSMIALTFELRSEGEQA